MKSRVKLPDSWAKYQQQSNYEKISANFSIEKKNRPHPPAIVINAAHREYTRQHTMKNYPFEIYSEVLFPLLTLFAAMNERECVYVYVCVVGISNLA